MTDSLSARAGRVIAASADALVSRPENQVSLALMEQAIREVDAIISEVRLEPGQISANHHLAQQQHVHLNARHGTLVEQAQQALSQDREGAAQSTGDSRQRLDSTTATFDRLYQRHAGLSPASAGASLEQAAKLKELDDLVGKHKISERLAKLRALPALNKAT